VVDLRRLAVVVSRKIPIHSPVPELDRWPEVGPDSRAVWGGEDSCGV
jgi:hypothetical protein